MPIKRRKITGRPLLVATTALSVTISCTGSVVSGNLMPPPDVELCIDVEPDSAVVLVQNEAFADEECKPIMEGSYIVTATAEGYVDYEEQVDVFTDMTHQIIMDMDEGPNE